ncbi:MAG: S-layer homology domain-containing protein [Candidatus Pristimantibacillus lignocellulolyticus]|uniref:S-layer homology domain-containing protein n=1 Tax=Candidatus Pristimantibacillus lignocellulolyticus TaxID=2994561 RepID=A0A9J6ZBA1_9BACL|nr:MAG: S-layer homology domain-containing protein [Candidatus Pristimantibacillus lignocellulolyticus]
MKFKWYKQLSAVLIIALLVSVMPVYAAEPTETKTATVIHFVNADDSTKLSAANGFFTNPYIVISEGKQLLEIEMTLSYDLNVIINGNSGTTVETKANTVVKRYEILNLNEPFTAVTEYKISSGDQLSSHNTTVIVGNDINSTKALLISAIVEAEALTDRSVAFDATIASAKTANTYLTKLADMQAALTALQAAINEHNNPTAPEPEPALEKVVLSFYKKETNGTYTPNYAAISDPYTDPYVYEKDGKTFLRVTQVNNDSINFQTKLNGVTGTTVEKLYNNTSNPTVVTHYVIDFEIPSKDKSIFWNVSYTAGSYNGSHDGYAVINQDSTDADRANLTEDITKAEAVDEKDIALQTAITLAKADNNLLTRKSVLDAHISRLTELTTNNDAILNSLVNTTSVDYINAADLTKSFNRNFASFFADAILYKVDDKNYLRIKVTNKFDLKLTIEGKQGQVAEYIGESGNITHVVYDYELSSIVVPVISKVTYVSGAHVGLHEQYIVINQDADTASRDALKVALVEAKAVANKGAALVTAINNAEAVDNLLTRKAELVAQTTALNAAIAANSTTTPPTGVEIHEGSGLETGYYTVSVSALQDTSDALSYMNGYLNSTARLLVTKDALTVYVVLRDPAMIQSLSVEGRSAAQVNNYTADNVARYSFNVSSLKAPVSGSVHVIAKLPSGEELYNTTHGIRLSFGTPVKVTNWVDEGYKNKVETDGSEKPDETDTDTGSNDGGLNGNNGGTTNPAPKFTDIDNSWAKGAIERAIILKLVTGYSDGTFKPNQEVNRAEFTAILVRAMKLDAAKGEVQFADADNIQGWAKEYIQQAVEAGIITGYKDNTFRPAGNITRAEAAVMIVKALGLELVSEDELSFTDASSIPAYARAYVATAVKHGLVVGYSNNTFGPNKVANRADAVTLALRALDYNVSHK